MYPLIKLFTTALEKVPLAEAYLKKALQLNPQSDAKELLSYVVQNGSLTVLNEGIDLYEKNNYQTALLKFNEVLKKEANNAYAYYYRGLIYDEQKQPKLAINDYLNVLKYSNEFPIANYMLAVDYDTLSNYKEAFKYYQKFISSYSTDDEYLKYAKRIVIKDACGSRAETEYVAGLERMKDNGAHILTTEIALFEWLKGAKHPNFKDIQALIK